MQNRTLTKSTQRIRIQLFDRYMAKPVTLINVQPKMTKLEGQMAFSGSVYNIINFTIEILLTIKLLNNSKIDTNHCYSLKLICPDWLIGHNNSLK